MEFSSYLLLLLVALSVSAVQEGLKEQHEVLSPDEEDRILGGCLPQGKNPSLEFPLTFGCSGKERHSLYHNYSSHSNNWIVKATVQFDGVEVYCFIQKTTGAWKYSPSGIGMMDVDYTFRNYSKKLYHHLKETDSDLTQRYGCEAERSSSGAVTLLNSTAEFRLNGKIVLRFNADRDQWEALDERFLAVKTEWDSLTHFNQIIKHYLLQGCTDRLRSYLKYYDDIRDRTSGVDPSDTHRQKMDKEEKEGAGVFSVLSCVVIACVAAAMAFALLIKKMGRKHFEKVVEVRHAAEVKKEIKHACRRHSDVMNDHQDGGDAVQTQRRSTASMDLDPPNMGRSTASMDVTPIMRRSMDFDNPNMGIFSSSLDFLHPDIRSLSSSMERPPVSMAEDDDGQTCSKNSRTRTAELTRALGRLRSTTISFPTFGRGNSGAVWV